MTETTAAAETRKRRAFFRYVEGFERTVARSDIVTVLGIRESPRSLTLQFAGIELLVAEEGSYAVRGADARVRIYFGAEWPANPLDMRSTLLHPACIAHPNIHFPWICDGLHERDPGDFPALLPPQILLVHHYHILVSHPGTIRLDDAFADQRQLVEYLRRNFDSGLLPTDRRPLFVRRERR